MVAHTTDQTFTADVIESDLPVVVDFMADWCMPCKQLGPVLEEVSTLLQGKVKFFKLNIDENQMIPNNAGIRTIPTLMLFKDGKHISTQGPMSKQKMLDWLQDV